MQGEPDASFTPVSVERNRTDKESHGVLNRVTVTDIAAAGKPIEDAEQWASQRRRDSRRGCMDDHVQAHMYGLSARAASK